MNLSSQEKKCTQGRYRCPIHMDAAECDLSVSEHPHKGPCSYDIKGECQGELLPVSEQKECRCHCHVCIMTNGYKDHADWAKSDEEGCPHCSISKEGEYWIKEFDQFVKQVKNDTGVGWHFEVTAHPTKIIEFIAKLLKERDRAYSQSALERAAKEKAVKDLIASSLQEDRERIIREIEKDVRIKDFTMKEPLIIQILAHNSALDDVLTILLKK